MPLPSIPDMIDFTQRVFNWTDKDYGSDRGIGRAAPGFRGKVVPFWDINRWKHAKEIPPKSRVPEIKALYVLALYEALRCPGGFQYLCNIGESYEDDRAVRALAMLDDILTDTPTPPMPMISGLQILIHIQPERLPDKVNAQCFQSVAATGDSVTFMVVARTMRDAADELWAHVFRPGPPSGCTIREE
jgi:hypothetical protein